MKKLLVSVLLFLLLLTVKGNFNDPRCAEHKCVFDRGPPADNVDSSICDHNRPVCPKCLQGPEWDSLLEEVGAGEVTRAKVPWLVYPNWLSVQIVAQIFHILASEVLGYNIHGVGAYTTAHDILCCDQTVINLELWPTAAGIPPEDGSFALQTNPNGYEGFSALFVPKYVTDQYPLATAVGVYKYLPEYRHIFSPYGATDCSLALQKPSSGCVDGNYQCNLEAMVYSNCTGPYWIPPQCEANTSDCTELIMYSPEWDRMFFEGLIYNLGLNWTPLYLGENLFVRVKEAFAKKENVVFYWYEPDPFISMLEARPIVFDPWSADCADKVSQIDPLNSTSTCGYERTALVKAARRQDLKNEPDLKLLFESFNLGVSSLNAIMKQHTFGGGNKSAYDASCDWVKGNLGTWRSWVRNTRQSANQESSSTTVVVVASVLASVVILSLLLIALFMLFRSNKAQFAPKNPLEKIYVVFLTLKRETRLWEKYPKSMATAGSLITTKVRSFISNNKCYEVKRIGMSFMVVTSNRSNALALAAQVQDEFANPKWDELFAKEACLQDARSGHSDTGSQKSSKTASSHKKNVTSLSSASGQRGNDVLIAIGVSVHGGNAQIDHNEEAGTYDYVGPTITIAALMADFAQGSQILVSKTVAKESSDLETQFGFFADRSIAGHDLSLMQYNPPGMPVRVFEVPSEHAGTDANVDSVAAALEQQSNGFTRMVVTVMALHIGALKVIPPDKSTKLFSDESTTLMGQIIEIVKKEHGHVEHVLDGTIVVTYNVASRTTQQSTRAFRTAVAINAIVGGEVWCGIASGHAHVGALPVTDSASQMVALGNLFSVAFALERYARVLGDPTIHTVCITHNVDELNAAAVFQVIDITRLPGSAKVSKILALMSLKSVGECNEWMYEMEEAERSNAFHGANTLLELLIQGKEAAAQIVAAGEEPGTEESPRGRKFLRKLLVDHGGDPEKYVQRQKDVFSTEMCFSPFFC